MTDNGLREAALSGARWTVAARIGLQLFTWPVTILVIRLLDPGDYGLLAMATVTIGFIALFSEMGMSVALVQAETLDEPRARTASAAILVCNATIALALVVAAPLAAAWFEEPDLTAVIRVLTLELLVAALAIVPQSQLERRLRFKELSIAFVAAGAGGAVVTLVLGLLGYGVWALVGGNLAVAVVRSALIVVFNGGVVLPSLRYGLAPIRALLRFGGHVLASRALWVWYGQSDQLILGRVLHATVLGHYSVAAQLAMLPVGKAMEVVNRVSLPVLSRMRSRPGGLRVVHARLLGLVAGYAFGICWGLAAVAPEFAALILGKQWEAAAMPLMFLAAVAPLRMLSALNNTISSAVGAPQAATIELAFAGLLIPAAVLAGAWLDGIQGACHAWAVAYPFVYLLSNAMTSKAVGTPALRALVPLLAPAASAALMWGCIWAVRVQLSSQLHVGVLLAVELVVGAAGYVTILHVLAPALTRDARVLILDLLRPRRTAHPG